MKVLTTARKNRLKHHKGTPITEDLKVRIRAALKILTLEEFAGLGDISYATIKRALRGERIEPRCMKELARCCDLFEFWNGKEESDPKVEEAQDRDTIQTFPWEVEQPSTDSGKLGTILDLIETWARRPEGNESEVRMILRALQSMPAHDPTMRIKRLLATCQ